MQNFLSLLPGCQRRILSVFQVLCLYISVFLKIDWFSFSQITMIYWFQKSKMGEHYFKVTFRNSSWSLCSKILIIYLLHNVFCAVVAATAWSCAVLRPPNPQKFWKISGFPPEVERPSMITQSYPNPFPVNKYFLIFFRSSS